MVLYPNKLPESERVCSGICTPNIHPGDIQAVTSIIIQIQIIRANLLSVPENKA